MLNTYLASIAIRTVRPEPPVRPRLRSRFEPEPTARIDPTDRFGVAAPGESTQFTARDERRPALETVPRPSNLRPLSEAHRVARPRQSNAETNPREIKAGHTAIPDQSVETLPQPPTVRPRTVNPRTKSRQVKEQVAFESDEKRIDQRRRSHDEPKTTPRNYNARETRSPTWPTKVAPARLREPQENEELIATRHLSRKVPLPADDEKEQPIRRRSRTVERELETIVVREKAIPNESRETNASTPAPRPPQSTAASPVEARERVPTLPDLTQSRIPLQIEPVRQMTLPADSRELNPPTVHVTIGRIEVRAVQTAQPPAKARVTTPVMNLDDYLNRRSQGGAR